MQASAATATTTPSPAVDMEKLAKLQRMAAGVRTGGKGSVRRKKKAVHKAAPTDDKRLQSTLKRLQLNQLPNIEEVNIIRENGTFIHFKNPKVQAQVPANTYVVSGTAETKPLTDLMSSVIAPGTSDHNDMANVRAYMERLRATGNLPKEFMAGLGDLAATPADNAHPPHSADHHASNTDTHSHHHHHDKDDDDDDDDDDEHRGHDHATKTTQPGDKVNDEGKDDDEDDDDDVPELVGSQSFDPATPAQKQDTHHPTTDPDA